MTSCNWWRLSLIKPYFGIKILVWPPISLISFGTLKELLESIVSGRYGTTSEEITSVFLSRINSVVKKKFSKITKNLFLNSKKTKFRKMHKGRNRGLAQNGNTVAFGRFGLVASDRGRITARQIEAARRAMTRHIKRGGNIWIRIFPDKPITKKPLEVRMGKGKGSPEFYACRVKPGRILFEVDGVSEQVAKEALYKASAKLPIKTKTIKRFL